jgi:hypothetical protein
MKFMRIMAKYTLQDYKTNEDILSEFNINPAAKISQHYLLTCSMEQSPS